MSGMQLSDLDITSTLTTASGPSGVGPFPYTLTFNQVVFGSLTSSLFFADSGTVTISNVVQNKNVINFDAGFDTTGNRTLTFLNTGGEMITYILRVFPPTVSNNTVSQS